MVEKNSPPIDPMLLVRAKAVGMSISDILAGMYDKVPAYRFNYLIEKAKSYASIVQSLGGALMSALEKKDAEELQNLRSTHEQNILNLTKDVKKKQIKDAEEQIKILEDNIKNIEEREKFYKTLVDDGLNGFEVTVITLRGIGLLSQLIGFGFEVAGGISAASVPQIIYDPVTQESKIETGGVSVAESLNLFARSLMTTSSILNSGASISSAIAGYERRSVEWGFQKDSAKREINPLKKQIISSEIKKDIAEKDLEIHLKNIEQSQEIEDFYKSKFSGIGLYNYLANDLNKLYSIAYKLAYECSQMAQTAYRFEMDDTNVFLRPDNWKADKAGLLAGERLMFQLTQMEKAYIENNTRQYEIMQSFSVQQINPIELAKLRQTGECDFTIPEFAFDLIYPGQYKRIIKSVRVTMPCIIGPYANVGCKFTLLEGKVRTEAKVDPAIPPDRPIRTIKSIVTSNAQSDSGMFEFNFRDERYLPFEGAGAVESKWKIQLPKEFRTFNYNSISDVIFHISYTAKEDEIFRGEVEDKLASVFNTISSLENLSIGINLKNEMPSEWHKFKTEGSVKLNIKQNRLPYFAQKEGVAIKNISIYAKYNEDVSSFKINYKGSDVDLKKDDKSNLYKADPDPPLVSLDEEFEIKKTDAAERDKISELIFVVNYGFVV